jgi:hypothetical protein
MEKEKTKKPYWGLGILGFNLVLFIAYSLMLLPLGEPGLFVHALIYCVHVVVCIIAAIVQRKWMWVFAALIIACIGFSTCTAVFFFNFSLGGH